MKPKKPSQISIILGLTKFAIKGQLRNRSGLIFSLVFPIAFVLLFGVIGNGSAKITLGISSDVSKESPVYKTISAIAKEENSPLDLQEGSRTDLEKDLSQSKLDGLLEPADTPTSVVLATANSNVQGAAAAQTFLNGVLNQLNLQAAGVTTPTFSIKSKEISGRSLRYIDYILPGQIGFSLLTLATFGVAFFFITLRRTLVLKRLFATSINPLNFIIAQGLARCLQAIVQASVILGVGIIAFHFNLAHGWITALEMMLVSILGVLTFLAFGIFISNIARNEESAPTAINLFNLPQMLLGGVFFPTDGLPMWLQKIGNNLPLAYLNNSLRKIALEGAAFKDVAPYIIGLLVWGIVGYILAARTFRQE